MAPSTEAGSAHLGAGTSPLRLLLRWFADVGFCLACMVLFAILALIVTHSTLPDSGNPVGLGELIATMAAGAAAIYRFQRVRGREKLPVGLSDRPSRGWWRLLLGSVLVVAVIDLVQPLVMRPFHLDPSAPDPSMVAAVAQGGWPLLFTFLLSVLIAPVTEEVLFRGLLLGRFAAQDRWRSGIAVSAVLFAAVHGKPANSMELLAGGLLLAWLYRRAGSLWPAIALHALNNLVAFVRPILSR